MIEAQQFLLWILRKLSALPKRWFNQLTDLYEYNDWPIPIMLITMGIGFGPLIIGVPIAAMGQSYLGSAIIFLIWSIGAGFIIGSGVRALYRAFKSEQREFIETLKR